MNDVLSSSDQHDVVKRKLYGLRWSIQINYLMKTIPKQRSLKHELRLVTKCRCGKLMLSELIILKRHKKRMQKKPVQVQRLKSFYLYEDSLFICFRRSEPHPSYGRWRKTTNTCSSLWNGRWCVPYLALSSKRYFE